MRKALVAVLLNVSLGIFFGVAVSSSRRSSAETRAEKNAAAVEAGKKVFTKICLQCHSINEGQVTFGPSLYGELKPPHPKHTPTEIRGFIENGKNGKMPSLKDKLSSEDIDNVLAYLHTI